MINTMHIAPSEEYVQDQEKIFEDELAIMVNDEPMTQDELVELTTFRYYKTEEESLPFN